MNEPPVVAPAGVVTRVLAAAVDAGTVGVAVVVLYFAAAGARFVWSPLHFSWPQPSTPVIVTVMGVVAVAYLAVSWATTGRTYGGGLLGLRVLSARHGLLGWTRSTLRALVCVLLPIGLFWSAVSPTRRSVQDVLFGSIVVYDWHQDRGVRAMAQHPATGAAPETRT